MDWLDEQCFVAVCIQTEHPGPAGPAAADAVATEPAGPSRVVQDAVRDGEGTPRPLGPQFRNLAIARLWLGNFLAATADSLELEGDHDGLAAAYRGAAQART